MSSIPSNMSDKLQEYYAKTGNSALQRLQQISNATVSHIRNPDGLLYFIDFCSDNTCLPSTRPDRQLQFKVDSRARRVELNLYQLPLSNISNQPLYMVDPKDAIILPNHQLSTLGFDVIVDVILPNITQVSFDEQGKLLIKTRMS